MSVTARSILSSALIGEEPYNQAERILAKLDAAGWEIVRKPRIPEPESTGAIVKDSDRLWVKAGDGLWICLSDGQSGNRTSWPFLENPTLIHEGLS